MKDFTTRHLVNQSPKEIFNTILDVRGWWSGLHAEEITGTTDRLNSEFTFLAGGGAHYSKQKLIEAIPGERIVWLVTDSKLTFLDNEEEWIGTKICFDISTQGDKTQVRFTHLGLVPSIECYNECSGAWSQYLKKFLSPLLSENSYIK